MFQRRFQWGVFNGADILLKTEVSRSTKRDLFCRFKPGSGQSSFQVALRAKPSAPGNICPCPGALEPWSPGDDLRILNAWKQTRIELWRNSIDSFWMYDFIQCRKCVAAARNLNNGEYRAAQPCCIQETTIIGQPKCCKTCCISSGLCREVITQEIGAPGDCVTADNDSGPN
jgi:hypothetical protein